MTEKLTINSSDIPFIVESINHPLWAVDINGIITFHNTSFANCWHLFFNSYPTSLSDIIVDLNESDKIEWKLAFELALSGKRLKKELSISNRVIEKHYELTSNPIFDEKFIIKGVTFIAYDITDKYNALKNEEQFKNTVMFLEKSALDLMSITSEEEVHEYVSECIYEVVPDSIVVSCSFEETDNCLHTRFVCGISKEVDMAKLLLGTDILNMQVSIDDDTKNDIILYSNKLVEIQGGLYALLNGEISALQSRRFERLMQVNKVYRLGIVKSGKLLGAIIIFTRFSHIVENLKAIEALVHQASVAIQRSKAEGELIMAKDHAEESDRLKSAFLANISHEIRTPINGILGFIQLLEMEDVEPLRRAEYMNVIRGNSHALLSILEDIIDISIIEKNLIKFHYENVNINNLLDEIFVYFSSSKYLNRQKDLFFKVNKGLKDEEAFIVTDIKRLKQIFDNLIGNAFKFTDAGSIEFGYVRVDNTIQFFVKDTGIGIDAQKLELVFKPFVQAEDCFSRRFGGSGLGLAISNGLLKRMEGSIWVETAPGKGSTFYFSLPIMPCQTQKEQKTTGEKKQLILN